MSKFTDFKKFQQLPEHNLKRLRYWAHAPMQWYLDAVQEWVKHLPFPIGKVDTYKANGQWYLFINNNANVLAVGHLDTVVASTPENRFMHVTLKDIFSEHGGQNMWIHTPFLDDRLGVYTILDYLPRIMNGYHYDILLTIDEETGRTSAGLFDLANHELPADRYNWIFEFDAVDGGIAKTYQYGDGTNGAWHTALTNAGFKTQYGSYTDIGALEHLGVKAVNISCAYYHPHDKQSYFDVMELEAQILRFLSFFEDNRGTRFTHTKATYTTKYTGRYSGQGAWGYSDDWEEDYYTRKSGKTGTWVNGKWQPKTQPKKEHPNYTDNRPLTMDWIVNGIEGNDHFSTFDHEEKASDGFKYNVLKAVHHDSGAIAAVCGLCQLWKYDEELSYDKGIPLCDGCRQGLFPAVAFHDTWLAEGGLLRCDNVRSSTDMLLYRREVMENQRANSELCIMCDQPDWKVNIKTVSDSVVGGVCRWCYKAIEANKLLAATATGNDVDDTQRILRLSDVQPDGSMDDSTTFDTLQPTSGWGAASDVPLLPPLSGYASRFRKYDYSEKDDTEDGNEGEREEE